MLTYACLYILVSVPYRFNRTRLAEETEKPPEFPHNLCWTRSGESKISPVDAFPSEKPHQLFNSYWGGKFFFLSPKGVVTVGLKVGYFCSHLLLKGLIQYCTQF